MKHYLNLILLLFFSISLSAQQTETVSHKHLMIDAINRGDYNQAPQELVLVTDWGDDVYLNVDSVITFISQVKENKLSISQNLIDSLSNYAYLSLQKSLYQEIDTAKHAEARLKYELLLKYNKLLLGEHNPKQTIILRNIGYCYYQEKNLELAEQYFINAFNNLPKNPSTEEDVENYIFVLNWLHKYYYEEKEDFYLSKEYISKLVQFQKKYHGTNHGEYIIALDKLAQIHYELSEYNLAEKYFLEVLDFYQHNTNEYHLEYVTLLKNLGILYNCKANYTLAKEYFTQAKTAINSEDEQYVKVYVELLRSIANFYCNQSNYLLAKEYFQKAIEYWKKNKKEVNKEYAFILADYGTLYKYIGEYSTAQEYYTSAQNILAKKAQEATISYASILGLLGNLMTDLGDYTTAESYFRQALDIVEKQLGKEHIGYLVMYSNMVQIDIYKERYTDAEEKYLTILKGKKKLLGENNPSYAGTLGNLGHVYMYKENYAKAKQTYEQAATIFKSTVGETHPDYATALSSIAHFYRHVQDYTSAEKYCMQALAIYKDVLGENCRGYINELEHIALLSSLKHEHDKAITYLLEVFDRKKKIFGEENINTYQTIKDLAIEYAKAGDSSTAEIYIKTIVKYYKRTHNEDFLGSIFFNIGVAFHQANKLDIAERYYLESIKYSKGDEAYYYELLVGIGYLYNLKGDFDSAEKYYLLAEEMADQSKLAYLLTGIAELHFAKQDYVTGKQYCLKALKLIENKADQIYLLNALGNAHCLMNDYDNAEKYFLQSLDLQKDIYGEKSPLYMSALGAMSEFYVVKGEFECVIDYLEMTLNIQKEVFGEEHIAYASTLSALGSNYSNIEGKEALGERYLNESIKIFEKLSAFDNIHYIRSLLLLGIYHQGVGNLRLAEQYSLKAYSIAKDYNPDDSSTLSTILVSLGMHNLLQNKLQDAEMYLLEAEELGQYEQLSTIYSANLTALTYLYMFQNKLDLAEEYLMKSLAYNEKIFGIDHPMYAHSVTSAAIINFWIGDLQSAKKYIKLASNGIHRVDISNYATLQYISAQIEFANNNYKLAGKYLKHAYDIKKTKFVFTTDYMTESQRLAYWQSNNSLFDRDIPQFVYRTYTNNSSVTSFAYDNELFHKGLLLSSSNSIRHSILNSGDSSLIHQWNELTEIKQIIFTLEAKHESENNYLTYIQQADSLEKQLTISSSLYRKNKEKWQITWDSIRNHLSPNEVAIEYFAAPLSIDSIMYCALLLHNNYRYPEIIPLFEEKEITAFLSAECGNITNKTYDFYANGDTISQLIWNRILPHLKEGETIYFAPSGLLHQLAIEYLPFDETHTMADVYNMVRLSSTREIVLNKPNTEHTTATIYGGIQYNLDADNLLVESEKYPKIGLQATRSIENDTLNRGYVQYLPGTKKEAEKINALLQQNNISVQLYTTAEANEESFKSLSSKHNNIIHIGTHGFTWTDSTARKQDYFAQHMQMQLQQLMYSNNIQYGPIIDPLNRCGLLFAGSNIALSGHSIELPDGVQDGILTAKEISLMDLRDADLVVLSACETAKGDITSEGVFGLQRAFKMAGVQTIIMSLWKVNDQATQLLMTEFYNNWIGKHQSKREAFRNAQNTVRTQYEEPEYWAGFIMLD